jgi:Na+/melibiose symporter-like transporter
MSAGEHAKETIVGLKVAIAWLPAAIGMISLIFIALSPINEQRHEIIRRRLDARLARAKTMTSMPESSPPHHLTNRNYTIENS